MNSSLPVVEFPVTLKNKFEIETKLGVNLNLMIQSPTKTSDEKLPVYAKPLKIVRIDGFMGKHISSNCTLEEIKKMGINIDGATIFCAETKNSKENLSKLPCACVD